VTGDGALFTREDAVEAAWAVVDPVLNRHRTARSYRRGSWGSKEADAIVASDGGWLNPRTQRRHPDEDRLGSHSRLPIWQPVNLI
jgi:glucose-6-phosphate 1-dehydrogenase